MRARLIVEGGDCQPPILDLTPGQPITLGRSRDNNVVVRDELASRLHAKIYFEDNQWFLRDFGLNGTWLDGTRISGSVVLDDGMHLQIGDVRLKFSSKPKSEAKTHAPNTPPVTALANTNRGSNAENAHGATKVHEHPLSRTSPTDTIPDMDTSQLRVDDITALCKFMSVAVEAPSMNELIGLALRAILHQTTAKVAGYLSFDQDDPTPKVVLPESASVDVQLSRKLTRKAYHTGKTVWMFADRSAVHAPTDSLQSFADAICIPLKASGEWFAALHAYRSGSTFTERDVRFIEAVAGYLAHGLETHRNRRTLEAENSRLRIHTPAADDIIGESSPVIQLRQQIFRAAPQPHTVLVQGESGAGKELVALALHRNSKARASGPLVVVNFAAISPSLLEAELFGYRKGAFSGADRDHPGLFQQADEGTLFLDEVGELSAECQAKLLRVIEGKAFRPVGATADVKADVRIVAATHRDLDKEVKAGRFRQDLGFRLKVIQIRVPPLREHPEDIPELAGFFLARLSSECRRNFKLTPAAMRKLQAYTWPGNVRQLRAVLESAAVMSEGDTLDADALPLTGVTELPSGQNAIPDLPPSLDMDDIETWAIKRALKQTGGNISHAARVLGMSRDTLHTKIKKKNIGRDAVLTTPDPVGIDTR